MLRGVAFLDTDDISESCDPVRPPEPTERDHPEPTALGPKARVAGGSTTIEEMMSVCKVQRTDLSV